jgi:phosphinothricin acetyltransferase
VAALIRDADPARDGEACARIYAPWVAETAVSFEEEPPTGADMAERIRQAVHSHSWLAAENEAREVVGYAYASPHRDRAAYRWACDVAVYVDSGHRGEGLGRTLYTTLFERLRRLGYHVACAGITLPNPASVGLHEALGFERVGVYRRIGWKLGRWHDVAWYELELVSVDEQANEGKPREPPHPTGPN